MSKRNERREADRLARKAAYQTQRARIASGATSPDTLCQVEPRVSPAPEDTAENTPESHSEISGPRLKAQPPAVATIQDTQTIPKPN